MWGVLGKSSACGEPPWSYVILLVGSFPLKAAGTRFVIEPYVRFAGEPGEQATMFFLDPCGNALEFKAFARDEMVFAR